MSEFQTLQEGDVEGLEGDDEGGEEEDFVLGCACGEYDVEDWLVMCDGCLQYFHALCIGINLFTIIFRKSMIDQIFVS